MDTTKIVQQNSYSLTDIYLPKRKLLTSRLQRISFLINDVTILVCVVLFFFSTLHSLGNTMFANKTFSISPLSSMLFILSGITLLFSAKKHVFNPQSGGESKQSSWRIGSPIFLAGITALLGFFSFMKIHIPFGLPLLITSPFSGFCFFLIGIALIPPYTKIPHRFHITQSLLFGIIAINALIVLESIYQLLSPHTAQHIFSATLPTAFIFLFSSFGILCRWSARGFFGNFTLETLDSALALRLLLINIFIIPFTTFFILLIAQKTSYNMYQIISLVVVALTVISLSIVWINVKLLYHYDLEHFVMREALRIHNIDLKVEKEHLLDKMSELEKSQQQYVNKLNYEDTFKNIAERFE